MKRFFDALIKQLFIYLSFVTTRIKRVTMNLFNVSSTQTAKLDTGSSGSSSTSDMALFSESQFLEQYQQAIDNAPPSVVIDDESISAHDVATMGAEVMNIDSEMHLADASDVIDTDNVTLTADSIMADAATDEALIVIDNDMIAIDDAVELIAAGNVFLQQLTQSNQQLNSKNITQVNSLDTNGKTLPPTVMSATTTVVTPTAALLAMKVTDNIDGQKSGVESDTSLTIDGGVNNSSLSTSTQAPLATTSHSDMLIKSSVFDDACLLTDDNRPQQSINSHTQGDVLAQQLTGLATTSTTPLMLKPEQLSIAPSLQSPLVLTREQAGEEVHERINMMMAKNLKYVDIRLDPPELGKLQIKLTINQDQASVQFTVNNHQARDIIEHAMPRLREMLHQQGLQLAQSSVQQDSHQQFADHQSHHSAHSQSQSGQQSSVSTLADDSHLIADNDPLDSVINVVVKENKDQVDYYA